MEQFNTLEALEAFAEQRGLAVVSEHPLDSDEPTEAHAVRPARAPGESARNVAVWERS